MNDVSTLPGLIDAHAVNELIASRAPIAIVDVRSPAEFETAHIPGSYNVPLDLLTEHASDLGRATGDPVILVCRSGARARQAEQALLAADLPRLHILDGGLSAWDAAGFALNRGRQRWSLERQVRFLAGGLVVASALGGVFVWTPLALVAAGIGGGLAYAAITDSCAMGMTLAKLPYNREAGCDVGAVLREMAAGKHPTSRESAPAILSGAAGARS